MSNLKVNFCGIEFTNPLVLPSGIIQEIPDHKRAIDAGVGAVTLKTLTPLAREGNPIPRVARYDHGFLNSVGFRNPGIEKGALLVRDFLKKSPVPVIVSLFAYDNDGYRMMAQKIAELKPPLIEVDISCPNVTAEFGDPVGKNKKRAAEVTSIVKSETGNIPVIVKLAADAIGVTEIAHACEGAGADAICATNTIGLGMLIDIKTRKPMLGNKFGGVSGPGIKPLAVKCIWDIYNAVDIPIIGTGGVATWQDVIEMMMVGATLVGIGSATYFKGMGIYEEVKKGLSEYMKREEIKNLKELVGVAHD
jgi:dihydroorotate dehydrogenase (NAD+) catalytic subunit